MVSDLGWFLLILLWTYAAVSKLAQFDHFKDQMSIQAFGRSAGLYLIYILPATELITVALLSFPLLRITGLYISISLLIVFTIYILLILLYFFPVVPCSCGGILEKLGWTPHLIFNLAFIAINIYALITLKRKEDCGIK